MSDICPVINSCCDKSVNSYSISTDCSLPVEYFNTEQTADCPDGTIGDPYTVPANTFSSFISQDDANSKALTYAIEQLTCTPVVVCEPCGGDDPQLFIEKYRFPQGNVGSLPISWNNSDLSQFSLSDPWSVGNDGTNNYLYVVAEDRNGGSAWCGCWDSHLLIFKNITRVNFRITMDILFKDNPQPKSFIALLQNPNSNSICPPDCNECSDPSTTDYEFTVGSWGGDVNDGETYEMLTILEQHSSFNNCSSGCSPLNMVTSSLATKFTNTWITRIYEKNGDTITITETNGSDYNYSGTFNSCAFNYVGGYPTIISSSDVWYKNITIEDV